MEIRDKVVLILGGAGQVGMAIARALIPQRPSKVVIASLTKNESLEAVEILRKESNNSIEFDIAYGNIFVRESLKDKPWREIQSNIEDQTAVMDDILGEMTRDILERSTLYQMIKRTKPDIIIDTINTATALAYQDVYTTAKEARDALDADNPDEIKNTLRKLISTLYLPQLVRHIQILYESMVQFGVGLYLKVGTTGTGGMGLNIPYTHGEERPSRVLLSKSAIAGAHTLLLFLADRTPGGPIVKEIKPAALIAWKGISAGTIRKHGRDIPLYDCPPEKAYKLVDNTIFDLKELSWGEPKDDVLRAVYVDTGENGVFSLEEFKAITTLGQMEAVTPEEIAQVVIDEIRGDSTSFDVVSALDASVMGPTYRAGFLRSFVIQRMKNLIQEKGFNSVAFEILGPPRLSKLLYEAELLKRTFHTIPRALQTPPHKMALLVENTLEKNQQLRMEMLSVGIPVLMSDGKRLLFARRPDSMLDKHWEKSRWVINENSIEHWTKTEWIDLRPGNMETWHNRFRQILEKLELPGDDTSSRFDLLPDLWPRTENGEPIIDPGECVGFIFIYEDKGKRKKR